MKIITIVCLAVSLSSIYTSAIDYNEANWPALCREGLGNSPIDYPAENSNNFVYTDSYIQLLYSNYTTIDSVPVDWNGERFGFNLPANPGSLMVRKNGLVYRYDLANVHYHVEAEHQFQGKLYEFEMHMVHAKNETYLKEMGVMDDPDKRNKYLVVGIVVKVSGTEENDLIKRLQISTNKTIDNLNFNKIVKEIKRFYHYEGGLTTPGCNEIVNWVSIADIFTMTQAQFDPIKKWLYEKFPTGNDRPPRPINNRTLYLVTNKMYDDDFGKEDMEDWKIAVSVVVSALGVALIAFLIWLLACKGKAASSGTAIPVETK